MPEILQHTFKEELQDTDLYKMIGFYECMAAIFEYNKIHADRDLMIDSERLEKVLQETSNEFNRLIKPKV
jgi:hypothetical protein